MRIAFLFLIGASCCSWAQTSGPGAATRSNIQNEEWLQVEEGPPRSRTAAIGHEVSTSWSYTAGGDMEQGTRDIGSLDSQSAHAAYTASIPLSSKLAFRAGIDYTRHSFGVPSGTLLPNTLQSMALTLGTDVELNEHWLMRFEMSPGLYSDFHDISFDDFNVPLVLGFTYLVDSRLQWVFGLAVDPLFSTKIQGISSPVLPGIGVRWQFADQWTLNAILPNPELQYDVADKLQLFANFRILGGSYRLRKDAGNGLGRQDFNNVVVDYQESRAGLGLRYKFHPALSLEAEGGYTLGRSFSYKNDDGLKYDGGEAPYVQIGLKGRF